MAAGRVPDIQMRFLEPKHHLGRGAFGQVIKALYRGEPVAMKVLENDSDTCRKQFLNEMEQLHSLRHSNIIQVIGKCSCNTKLAFIMELMDNGSLEDLLHRHLHLVYKADHVISWARQCVDAVSFIHDKGFVHRDLKPTNLLLKDEYRILKLCDFGTVSTIKTSMTNNQGTPSWMAPEVFKGKKYNVKCDVYSFGITLWEMVARKRPFGDESSSYTILWKACSGHRPPIISDPGCHPVIMDLITYCWAEDPDVRPAMREVLEVLTELTKAYPNGKDPLGTVENAAASEIVRINLDDAEADVPTTMANDAGYHSGQTNTLIAPQPCVSDDGHLRFLESLDPSLRPVTPRSCREEETNLYFNQLAACQDLCKIEDQLQKACGIKHGLIARLRHVEETVKQIERRDQLRALLQESHARICSQKQIPPTPL